MPSQPIQWITFDAESYQLLRITTIDNWRYDRKRKILILNKNAFMSEKGTSLVDARHGKTIEERILFASNKIRKAEDENAQHDVKFQNLLILIDERLIHLANEKNGEIVLQQDPNNTWHIQMITRDEEGLMEEQSGTLAEITHSKDVIQVFTHDTRDESVEGPVKKLNNEQMLRHFLWAIENREKSGTTLSKALRRDQGHIRTDLERKGKRRKTLRNRIMQVLEKFSTWAAKMAPARNPGTWEELEQEHSRSNQWGRDGFNVQYLENSENPRLRTILRVQKRNEGFVSIQAKEVPKGQEAHPVVMTPRQATIALSAIRKCRQHQQTIRETVRDIEKRLTALQKSKPDKNTVQSIMEASTAQIDEILRRARQTPRHEVWAEKGQGENQAQDKNQDRGMSD